ncbi:MAG: helix-turn-helix domain-containing protein [Dehalococcoidia bacterium]|nr:helix-turn-helix domain-containing protein [Dehalococcoidia bacterium]
MDNKIIGKRLRAVREATGFTQEQVAKYLDTKREIISYIETGARPVNTLMLRKLADLYGYKFSYFVDESVKEDGPQVSMAFRVSDLSDSDLPVIAQVKKIALNLDSLYNLPGE